MFSLQDSVIRPDALMKKVKDMGMSAVAVTDHGTMSGVVEFYEAAKKNKVKPILGVEAYVTSGSMYDKNQDETRFHIVLLAENNIGYSNIVKLVSAAHRDGFYGKPRVDKKMLAQYAEGVIALSGCIQGEIPRCLLKGSFQEAESLLEQYRAIFPGSFYLEVQSNGLVEQARLNEMLVRLAKKTSTPLVATGDCHYLEKEDAKTHEILLCLQEQKTISSADRKVRYGSNEFYVKSPEEMVAAFSHIPEAITNTLVIADRCNVTLSLGENQIPRFHVPEGVTSDDYLRQKAAEGLNVRLEEKRSHGQNILAEEKSLYEERLRYELEVIGSMGFSAYFLIVWDFLKYARDKKIPVGPGRGSAAGSLVAYALQITEIDPITYSLLFERFLNPDRISLPDIDNDFCKNRRGEVVEYVKEKYGANCVAQLAAFGSMKARAAVRDVGRVLEVPYGDVDSMAKLVPAAPDITLDKAMQMEPRLVALVEGDARKRELFDLAKNMEGLVRHASTHAAGVVIGDKPIDEVVPLLRQSDGSITTGFDMRSAEKAGLVKFDFLGLAALSLMQDTLDMISERTGASVDLNLIPMGDEATFKLLQAGDTDGVFQAESQGFTDLLIRLKPERFSHLIDMVALYRPGPLQSGMVDDFIKRRHGKEDITYALPELKSILENSYGVIVYQEQVMEIARSLGGFTLGQADTLRKAMGKKNAALMQESKVKFVEGAVSRGVSEEKATELFDLMAQFSSYGFNKSHAAAYALIAYRTAYLKAHYPVEFMTALLSLEAAEGKTGKVMRYMHRCRKKGIEVLPPDVNESLHAFSPVGEKIRFGLTAIKGLGNTALESIAKAKKAGGNFSSVGNFFERVSLRKVNKKALECLVKAGAFDSLDPNRGAIFEKIPELIEKQNKISKDQKAGQFSLFGAAGETPKNVIVADENFWSEKERLEREKEAVGFYVTGHPINEYESVVGDVRTITSSKLENLTGGAEVCMCLVATETIEKAGKKGPWGLVTAEDEEGIITLKVFGDSYRKYHDLLKSGEPIAVYGRVEEGELSNSVIADVIMTLPDAITEMTEVIRIETKKESAEIIPGVRKVIQNHPGTKDLVLLWVYGDGSVGRTEKFKVRPTMKIDAEIGRLLGYKAVTRKINRAWLIRKYR